MTIRELGLGMAAVVEQVRRAFFNVMARNQDDHVKNISFLMDRSGQWALSPAHDLTYSYNPAGPWTRDHQMSLAGRRNDFESEDLFRFAASSGLKRRKELQVLEETGASRPGLGPARRSSRGSAAVTLSGSKRPSDRSWCRVCRVSDPRERVGVCPLSPRVHALSMKSSLCEGSGADKHPTP